MTIKNRNILFTGCLGLMLAVFAGTNASALAIFLRGLPAEGVRALVDFASPFSNLLFNLVMLVYALTAGFLFQRHFRKTSSAEVFFFFLFLVLTAPESLRIFCLAVQIFDHPYVWAAYLSKAVYALHLMGTLCLFASGLFAAGLAYQRLESVLGICVLITIFLGPVLPLNTPVLAPNLLLGLGLTRDLLGIFLGMEVLAVLNYLYAARFNSNRSYGFMALALALVFIGRELVFVQANPAQMIAGFLCLCLGTWLFGYRAREIYLWF
jgi:hypothetical protein